MTVGYLGNLGTDTDPESDQAAVWRTRTAAPQLIGPAGPAKPTRSSSTSTTADRPPGCRARFTEDGFPVAEPAIWRTGWTACAAFAIPAAARAHPVVVTQLNDINARGAIVGNVYGLAGQGLRQAPSHLPRPLDLPVWAGVVFAR